MLAALVSLGFFVVVAAAIAYYGWRHYARPGRYYEQLGTVAVAGSTTGLVGSDLQQEDRFLVKIIQQVGERVPISPDEASMTRRFLMAAGFRSDEAIRILYGIKVIAAVVLFAVGFFLADYVTTRFILKIMLIGALTATGFWGPNFILEELVSRRQERIKLSLPDALDLMVVCVEAGLGLDQAIMVVSRELAHTHPDICDELRLVNLEIQAGKRRSDALRNLADRTGEAELRKLVAVLIQTDRFGTSMADSLRTHSDFLRIKRRQEAEERAAKIGVKLIFPIFFFILPTMFIIVGGVAVIKIFKEFFPLLRSLRGA